MRASERPLCRWQPGLTTLVLMVGSWPAACGLASGEPGHLRYRQLLDDAPALPPPTEATATLIGEEVHLTLLPPATIRVRVELVLRGPLPTMLLFPETEWFSLRDFQVVAGDQPLVVEHRSVGPGDRLDIAGHPYAGLFSFRLPATDGAEQRHTVTYTYDAPVYGPGSKGDGPTGRYVEYVLRTGATWHDSIGSITVFFDTGAFDCTRLVVLDGGYAGDCETRSRWRFSAHALEPDRDIRLLLPEPPPA